MATPPESKKTQPFEQAAQKGSPESVRVPVEDSSLDDDGFNTPNKTRYLPSDRFSAESISDEDRLDRGKLVSALAAVLAGKSNQHQTIGLLGDWGTGKSTTINLLKKELRKNHEQQPFLFAKFNAWEYEHTDNIQAGIAQEMIKGLTSYQPSEKCKQNSNWFKEEIYPWLWWFGVRIPTLIRFAVALNGPRILVLLVMILLATVSMSWSDVTKMAAYAVDAQLGMQMFMGGGALVFVIMLFRQFKSMLATPLAKELLTYIKLPSYGEHLGAIPVMRQNIRKLCGVRLNPVMGKPKRLLFVVDDLDRCNAKGIVKVFEAVRLVLDLRQVTVIIAVDHRIALAALALQYKELAEHHQLSNPRAIARDYLAKVIHQSISLSAADTNIVNGYLEHIWAEMEENVGEFKTKGVSVLKNVLSKKVIETDPSGAVFGLSTEQKESFKQWAEYFGFSNPRQLKRLHNSYNLLRLYFGGEDFSVLPQLNIDLSAPLLTSLFALEYINSLEDPAPRTALMERLKQKQNLAFNEEPSVTNELIDPAGKINDEVLSVMLSKHPSSGRRYVEAVEPFVLPAIQLLDDKKTEPTEQ